MTSDAKDIARAEMGLWILAVYCSLLYCTVAASDSHVSLTGGRIAASQRGSGIMTSLSDEMSNHKVKPRSSDGYPR